MWSTSFFQKDEDLRWKFGEIKALKNLNGQIKFAADPRVAYISAK